MVTRGCSLHRAACPDPRGVDGGADLIRKRSSEAASRRLGSCRAGATRAQRPSCYCGAQYSMEVQQRPLTVTSQHDR